MREVRFEDLSLPLKFVVVLALFKVIVFVFGFFFGVVLGFLS